jgi:hypothetical protein
MDFRVNTTDLDRKRLSVHAIRNDIVATLGLELSEESCLVA